MANSKIIFALLCLIPLTSCKDGKPIVVRSTEYSSPDGRYTATVEEVDNGMGFGLGALYDEVHVTCRGYPVGAHGDPGCSVVFYAESTYVAGRVVKVTWVTSRCLRVEYYPEQHPGRESHQLGDIAIEILELKPR